MVAGARSEEGAQRSTQSKASAQLRPPHRPPPKLFFYSERLRVAMKTDFPRGPTLPLRSIGLENPKWPDSRDKKGPLSGGPERESGGPFALSVPHTVSTPPRVSASPRAQAAGHSPRALAKTPGEPHCQVRSQSPAPVPDPRLVVDALA